MIVATGLVLTMSIPGLALFYAGMVRKKNVLGTMELSLASLDFAGGTVVHLSAGVAGLIAALVMGKRRGYGEENLAPFDLSLAVIGTGLLWVGWFGFNGGSALRAGSHAVTAIAATHLSACTGALTRIALEWWVAANPRCSA